jgi:integrase
MGHRFRLCQTTLTTYSQALVDLAAITDLDDVFKAQQAIPDQTRWRAEAAAAAYRLYCRYHRLPEPEILLRRDNRRPLPKVPMEQTLQASLTVPQRLKWAAYFRLLYETGARASEPFKLQVQDIDFQADKIRLGTSKYGGQVSSREIPISRATHDRLYRRTHGMVIEDLILQLLERRR